MEGEAGDGLRVAGEDGGAGMTSEATDVLAQLPKDLKELWTEAQIEAGARRERA